MSECVDLYSAQSLEYNALDALVTRANKYVLKAKFHYTDPTRTGHGQVRARCRVRAKFHYTDPTGPARTQRSFAAKKSVRVRAGPVGSVSGPCQVRAVEFSFK